uniref:TFIID subunit TAF5 NTD2 domain-containing protein n=1 Tax=Clastoptera arizonana TaxID=38151 RepID=A0A1B6DPN1_9HEMI
MNSNIDGKRLDGLQNLTPIDKNNVLAVLQLLKKYNLKETEESLKREANLSDIVATEAESEVSNVLSAYKSEGDPNVYEEAYTDLKKFVEGALDIYKHELGMILYPVFVHMYLELVYNGHEEKAIKFMDKFSIDQEIYYQEDLKRLSYDLFFVT